MTMQDTVGELAGDRRETLTPAAAPQACCGSAPGSAHEAASTCCGTPAEAAASGSCCGDTVKAKAIASGAGCCG